jgi:hypothetical protein
LDDDGRKLAVELLNALVGHYHKRNS